MGKRIYGPLVRVSLALGFTLVAGSTHAAEIIAIERPAGLPFYLISVKISNVAHEVKMLLDTGASETVLAQWFVDDQKIKQSNDGNTGKDATGTEFKFKRTENMRVQAGKTQGDRTELPIVPLPSQFKDLKIGGIFSPQSFFRGKAIEINFLDSQLIVDPNAGRTDKRSIVSKVPIQPCSKTKPDKYLVGLTLNEKPGSFYLDTGGVRSAMTKAFSESIGKLQIASTAEREGVASKRKVEQAKGLKLKVGAFSDQVGMDIEPGKVSCPSADGKLGADWLQNFSIILSADRTELTLLK